jgi:hypothetical protein
MRIVHIGKKEKRIILKISFQTVHLTKENLLTQLTVIYYN